MPFMTIRSANNIIHYYATYAKTSRVFAIAFPRVICNELGSWLAICFADTEHSLGEVHHLLIYVFY